VAVALADEVAVPNALNSSELVYCVQLLLAGTLAV
jgi:hypothetical protein